jgi:hypothetical protein
MYYLAIDNGQTTHPPGYVAIERCQTIGSYVFLVAYASVITVPKTYLHPCHHCEEASQSL